MKSRKDCLETLNKNIASMAHIEVAELRRSLAEANQKREMESKTPLENDLMANNKKVSESPKNESYNQPLSQVNEGPQCKLRRLTLTERLNRLIEKTRELSLNRSILIASLNQRHGWPKSFDLDDLTQFSSPNVKNIVKKSDSVSYLLDLDDSPETKVNRIVRRSFCNLTLPSSVSTKSPSNSDNLLSRPVPSVRSSTTNGKQKMCHESDNSYMEDNNELDEIDDIKLLVGKLEDILAYSH